MTLHAAALSQRARQAARARDWPTVAACASALLQRNSRDPEGHFLAGLAAQGVNHTERAAAGFAAALAADPGRYDAAVELAELRRADADHVEACALLDQAVPLLGNSPMYLDKAGTTYARLGLHARAAPLFEAANRLQPGVERLQANLAECLVTLGRLDEAAAIFESLLARFPRHQRYHYQLANVRRARDDRHLAQMQAALAASGGPPARNIFLYYAIGKALEDLGRWDEAFEYYRAGGDAAKAASGYRVEPDLELIERLIETCTADWLAEDAPPAGGEGPRPVFITGLPRTGTTLAEQILASHSRVESAGESFYFPLALQLVAGARPDAVVSPRVITAAARQPPEEIARRYLRAIRIRLSNRPLFIEKLPENFLYLGFIARALPDARLVHLRRDPMDACFALYKQSYFRYAYALDDLGRYYLAYDRLWRHWQAVLGDRLIELRYENLVADPAGVVPDWLARLGLDFEPACLEFHRRDAVVASASAAQVREGIHTRSVGRWRCFERQLEPLRRQLEAGGIVVD